MKKKFSLKDLDYSVLGCPIGIRQYKADAKLGISLAVWTEKTFSSSLCLISGRSNFPQSISLMEMVMQGNTDTENA